MLFSKTQMKRLLPKKKPGRKKKVKRVLLWKYAWKVLLDGGCIRHGKRVNSEEGYVKLVDKEGKALCILHPNTYRALMRKNRIICTISDHRMVANMDWRKKIFKVDKRRGGIFWHMLNRPYIQTKSSFKFEDIFDSFPPKE